MSALRQAALRRLTSDLASHRLFADLPDGGFSGDRAEVSALIDAFVAIGGLSAEDAATWRGRFERAAVPPQFEPELHVRAREHLTALRDRRSTGVDRLGAAVAAYRGVGLLTSEEAADWRCERDEPSAPETGEHVDFERAPFDDSVFRGVLLGPERRVAGLRVTAVELYEGAVVIQWHYSAVAGEDSAADAVWKRIALHEFEDDDDEGFEPAEPVTLADDAGTRYSASTGGWSPEDGGGVRTARGHSGFGPGVPADASHLEVLVGGEAIALSLD